MKLLRITSSIVPGLVATAASAATVMMPVAALNESDFVLLPLAGFVVLNLGLYVLGRERRHGQS
jgi:hypothetical protein